MARIKGGLNAKKRHKRILKLAKGYRGARSKQYRIAKQSVMRALASSYAGRKERKRQFRQLWIARINAAARINGLSLQQVHVRSEGGRRGHQQEDAGRDGSERCGRIQDPCGACQEQGGIRMWKSSPETLLFGVFS